MVELDYPTKVLRGAGELVLYLDFDGVLHHENVLWHPNKGAYLCAPSRYTLFQHAELLAEPRVVEVEQQVRIPPAVFLLVQADPRLLHLGVQHRPLLQLHRVLGEHQREPPLRGRAGAVHFQLLRRSPAGQSLHSADTSEEPAT